MMLPHTDTTGRYWANAAFIKGQCLPLFDHVRLEQVEEALLDLERVGLIHLFDVGGKRYLVYHDSAEHNPTGGLKYQKSEWPSPPPGVCKCQSRRDNDVVTAASLSPSSSSPPPPPEPETEPPEFKGEAAQLAIAWIRGSGERCKKETAMNKIQAALDVGVPSSEIRDAFKAAKGEKIWEILDPLRDKRKKSSVDGNKFRQVDPVCQNCGGSGSTVAGPCPGCKKGRELRRAQA